MREVARAAHRAADDAPLGERTRAAAPAARACDGCSKQLFMAAIAERWARTVATAAAAALAVRFVQEARTLRGRVARAVVPAGIVPTPCASELAQ